MLTKSPVAEAIVDSQGGFSIVKSIVRNLRGSFLNPQGIFLLLMVPLMYCGWALTAAGVERRNVAVVAGVASLGSLRASSRVDTVGLRTMKSMRSH